MFFVSFQNSKLYYVNAMNNIKGNIYFEFWGENDNTNYIIGKSSESGESILFNDKNIVNLYKSNLTSDQKYRQFKVDIGFDFEKVSVM